jgi:hypothetical protein
MPFGLLLFTGLVVAAPPPPPLDNLAFSSGRLTHWEGEGFRICPADGNGPGLRMGVCSGDNGKQGRKALLYRAFVVPPGTGAIRFRAAAVRPAGVDGGPPVDVLLEIADRQLVAKRQRTAAGWRTAERVASTHDGRTEEYYFPVEHLANRWVRLILQDDDARPGCHLVCSGFRLVPREEMEYQDFSRHMRTLVRDHNLRPPGLYESNHFLALSNADEVFTERSLYHCEVLHATFFDHFRQKGFAVREPKGKMMVALFESQAGFEAYLGRRIPPLLTGMYHRDSNRLAMYDYATNRAFAEGRDRVQEKIKEIPQEWERRRVFNEFSRQVRDIRDDANTSIMMHEAAHQLSFNGGLLNRQGDVPAWLAEGLACYCEPTVKGTWRGPGEPNPQRLKDLARPIRMGQLLPLRSLVENDDWLRKATSGEAVLLGYAQSWALFRFLMEEEPEALRKYLALIQARRTPEHRLADFGQAFGNLDHLAVRYLTYLHETLAREEGR